MITAARIRRLPVLTLALALAAGTALHGGPPAHAAASAESPRTGQHVTEASAADPRLAPPTVSPGGSDFDDIAAIHLIVGLEVGELDLREPRFEYRIDGSGSWRTAWQEGLPGSFDGATVIVPAPAGPHALEFRAAGLLDGVPVVGQQTASETFSSIGRVLPYTPVISTDGPRITVSWDVRPVLNGWPEERSVTWSFDGEHGGTASAVGSATFDAGYDRTVTVYMNYGGNVDYDRYLYIDVTTGSAPGSIPLTSAPVPTILGDARVGTTLSVRTGTWRPAPVELNWQWFADGEPIPFETQPTYLVGPDEAGKRITVAVRGSRVGYLSVTRTSGPTARVPAAVIRAATPVISGVAAVGRELLVRPGSWRPAPVTFRYQWLRDGEDIRGATATRYVVADADRGHVVSVRVIGEKRLYPDEWAFSAGRRIG